MKHTLTTLAAIITAISAHASIYLAPTAAYASYAYDAAYASYAYDAAHAAAYDDESARASCRKEQADIIRSIIPCPFESESGVKLERKF